MEIHQLRYVVAVAATGSFSQAAKRCHVSQPSLSQQVQKLEREFGQRLFERGDRAAILTPAGQILIGYATSILEKIDEATRAVQATDDLVCGPLNVGAIPTIAPFFLPSVIAQFGHCCPAVDLNIHEDMTAHLLQFLSSYEIDLALVSLPISTRQFEVEILFPEELLLVVPASHRLAKQADIRLADLRTEKFILLRDGHCLGEQALSFCNRHQFRPKVVFWSAQIDTIQSLVVAEFGISLIPTMARMSHRTELTYRSLAPPSPSRTVVVAWKKRRQHSKAALEFLKLLRAASQNVVRETPASTLVGNADCVTGKSVTTIARQS